MKKVIFLKGFIKFVAKTNNSGANIQKLWCKKQIYQNNWRVKKTNRFGAKRNYILLKQYMIQDRILSHIDIKIYTRCDFISFLNYIWFKIEFCPILKQYLIQDSSLILKQYLIQDGVLFRSLIIVYIRWNFISSSDNIWFKMESYFCQQENLDLTHSEAVGERFLSKNATPNYNNRIVEIIIIPS